MPSWLQLLRLLRLRQGLPLVRRADGERDRAQWIDAVIHYRLALSRMPWRQDLHIQIGNCLKEFGDYQGAIRAYSAVTGGPSLSEARKQTADANRRSGTTFLPFLLSEAAIPNGTDGTALPPLTNRLLPNRIRHNSLEPRSWLGSLGRSDQIRSGLRGAGYTTIKLDQVGAMTLERDGAQEPLFAGVVAIRGRISTLVALERLDLHIGTTENGYHTVVPLRPVTGAGPLRLYVFNAWIDSAKLPRGRHWLSLGGRSNVTPTGLFVNIADPIDALAFASSNSFVFAAPEGLHDLDRVVEALPAVIRPAARTLFDHSISKIVALRVDQLGDLAASLAALARLRALFPAAKLFVLAQQSVRAVIEASGLADEVIEITLDYDPVSGNRHLALSEEVRLRAQLARHAFDLAVDLSPGDESRPLLLLTDAIYLVGFNPDRFPYLDFGIAMRSRDKVNQKEKLSHGAAVMMLIEALAVAITPARLTTPRHSRPDLLLGLGLRAKEYIVLHLGARHAINRWPAASFARLCERLLAETAYELVLFAGNEVFSLPDWCVKRVRQYDVLEPDLFDCVLSNAKAVVGNDSGPKHLAAARGVPIVSVHVDRLNWNEWGQDGIGTIISKRMPCTGCGLNDISLCGREAVCVRSITPDEVFSALTPYL